VAVRSADAVTARWGLFNEGQTTRTRRTAGAHLAEAAGLTLGLHEGDNVVLTDGADDVADDGAGVVEELAADLGDTTAGAGTAENLDDASVDRRVLQTRVPGGG
jgi:hypothetical protein